MGGPGLVTADMPMNRTELERLLGRSLDDPERERENQLRRLSPDVAVGLMMPQGPGRWRGLDAVEAGLAQAAAIGDVPGFLAAAGQIDDRRLEKLARQLQHAASERRGQHAMAGLLHDANRVHPPSDWLARADREVSVFECGSFAELAQSCAGPVGVDPVAWMAALLLAWRRRRTGGIIPGAPAGGSGPMRERLRLMAPEAREEWVRRTAMDLARSNEYEGDAVSAEAIAREFGAGGDGAASGR